MRGRGGPAPNRRLLLKHIVLLSVYFFSILCPLACMIEKMHVSMHLSCSQLPHQRTEGAASGGEATDLREEVEGPPL